MRLWHKELIEVLPQKQLLAQWRECCAIASNIRKNGTPNHILVNYILCFNSQEFIRYTKLVLDEMKRRGYKVSNKSFVNFVENMRYAEKYFNNYREEGKILFKDVHNKRYFWQCYMNIQEKYDRGMFSDEEWKLVESKGKKIRIKKGEIKLDGKIYK